ncbi:MAG: 50S ribosomal protein L22 [Candidatus Aenigmarchaeota archaeon ex4484_52]|nr:MAG: 50S ribosomal protein L22 [Candidatus Aenigmarchaeota archaeon ex4484_52]
MTKGYSIEQNKLNQKITSKVLGKNLPISRKYSVEVGRNIKGINLKKARDLLKNSIEKKKAIRFTKYKKSAGHRLGGIIGRYPVNVCKSFDNLLNTLEKNAIDKGLDEKKLIIKYVFVAKAFKFTRRRKTSLNNHKRKNVSVSIIGEEKN